jgi:hypothetical protein
LQSMGFRLSSSKALLYCMRQSQLCALKIRLETINVECV